MLKLADDYRFGENGAPKNIEIGVTWYRKAAEAGNVEAMQKLSKFLYVGIGIAADPNQSIIWRTKAAEAGNIEAMIALADMYGKGTSSAFPKNDTEALRWYRRAAEQGDTFGMSMVGTFYYNGRGVPESNEEAVAWWRKRRMQETRMSCSCWAAATRTVKAWQPARNKPSIGGAKQRQEKIPVLMLLKN